MRKTRYSYLMQYQRRERTHYRPPNRPPIVFSPREQLVLLDIEDRYERERALADELEERWPSDADET